MALAITLTTWIVVGAAVGWGLYARRRRLRLHRLRVLQRAAAWRAHQRIRPPLP